MINIVLASHGRFCEELLSTLKMVAGDDFAIQAVPLFPGESAETYRSRLAEAIQKNYTTAGILVISDIVGGTPYNSAVYLSKDYTIGIVSGMNMPMLLTVGFSRNEESSLDELIALAAESGSAGVKGTNLSKERGNRREKLSINKNR
jgi:PTS system mannose-specific IIA component